MYTVALNYKQIRKIKDERFDEDMIHQYDLLIHIGTRDLQVGVVDPTQDRMLVLEDYVFPALSSHEELVDVLDELFDAHAFLRAAFWRKIKISVKNNKFVQVPEVLYVDDSKINYLRFNAQIDPDESHVLSVRNVQTKAVTVFALHKNMAEWLGKIYPNVTPCYMHQSAAMIEGVTRFSVNRKTTPLYIYIDRFRLHILAARQGELLYYNQFVIHQFSDYVKYMMLVMKALQLEAHTVPVVLWGYIGENSVHHKEFKRYFSNVVFGPRPKFLQFGYVFDEVQDHQFFDLYGMHLIDGEA